MSWDVGLRELAAVHTSCELIVAVKWLFKISLDFQCCSLGSCRIDDGSEMGHVDKCDVVVVGIGEVAMSRCQEALELLLQWLSGGEREAPTKLRFNLKLQLQLMIEST
jgi:hypothetical protein